MQINTAIQKAEQMANLFQAFKDIQEVLELAQRAENLRAAAEREGEKLKAENESLREVGKKEHDRIQKKTDDLIEKLKQAELAGRERLANVQNETQKTQAQAQEEIRVLKDKFTAQKKALALELADLESQKAAARGELAALRQDIDRIKSQVANI